MDTKNEDTIVRQIEKNLSNNINDNLFLAGRTVDNGRTAAENNRIEVRGNNALYKPEQTFEELPQDYPLVSNDYISNAPGMTRAEYIRQAREACLRQMSNAQIYSRPYDVNYLDTETVQNEQVNEKKVKARNPFHNGTQEDNKTSEENPVQELNAYHSLIIRCVLAIVLFLCIFAFDKFDFKAGVLTNSKIQEFVTGNDAFEDLENILVTWLK